jgi:DNA ligase (NAD+)
LDRFAKKSAENLINSIEASKSVPFERVLYAIGIRYVGETVAKKIAAHFTSIEELMVASQEDLMNVGEIGEVIAGSIIAFFSNPVNRELIQRLLSAGLQLRRSETDTLKTVKLAGKSFVVSGTFSDHSRDEMHKLIEENGGKNSGSVSSNTDFVVAGEGMGPSKKEKATKLGIPIITEQDLMNMIK